MVLFFGQDGPLFDAAVAERIVRILPEQMEGLRHLRTADWKPRQMTLVHAAIVSERVQRPIGRVALLQVAMMVGQRFQRVVLWRVAPQRVEVLLFELTREDVVTGELEVRMERTLARRDLLVIRPASRVPLGTGAKHVRAKHPADHTL